MFKFMAMSKQRRKLFYLRENPFFPEGTLVELENTSPLMIPDRGDGKSVEYDLTGTVECPPFAENIPPGQCRVMVTSFAVDDAKHQTIEIEVDESIHFQVLVIPQSVVSVIVVDRVGQFEADSYFPSPSHEAEYRLHVGHLKPGFYEAEIDITDGSYGRLTFIKFYPPRFSEGYGGHLHFENSASESINIDRSVLLNKALEFATEWGENFRKPINDRIRVYYPGLSDDEIDELTRIVTTAESRVYAIAELELEGRISEYEIVQTVIAEFPWMSVTNAARLKSIGMYYARR
jgi:hypothetical protein